MAGTNPVTAEDPDERSSGRKPDLDGMIKSLKARFASSAREAGGVLAVAGLIVGLA